MLSRKSKKVGSMNTKKKERIEVLDFEENTKYEEKKPKLKFHIKNKFRFSMVCLVIVVILLTSTSLITGKNVVSVGVKRVLNGLGVYTEEIRNVEIQSDDYNEPGSWHIDKSAKWTGTNKARITFDVQSVMKVGEHYKDVVLVLDVSGSMGGAKLEKAISDSKELVSYLLSNDKNRVAIVTFDTVSNIVSEFSNKKEELLTKLDAITVTGCTNYNAALQNVDVVMNGYIKESNRDIMTLFLTDGYPNEDTPNQVGTYEMLKDKYPDMTINGVQYEMGVDVIEEIKQITDSQWVADQSTLNNVLFDAVVSPAVYEDFIVTDYIHDDYFRIDSVDDIKVTMGTVKLEEESSVQKIVWNLGHNSFMTGSTAKMMIDATIKEQYVGSEGYYPTNKKENIISHLPEETEKTVNSTSTPVLKSLYEVIYDVNTPEGCTLDPITREKHFVYQNVSKKTNELSCDGYLFKGWEIDENDEQDIKKVNDDVFVMPEHDVMLRATWTKQTISKTMDGTVHEKTTFYKLLQNLATTTDYVEEYTGNGSENFENKVYYYQRGGNYNNVLFANFCWKMIRSTETGGVKLMYNGLPSAEGTCNNRESATALQDTSKFNLESNSLADAGYMYNTRYRSGITSLVYTESMLDNNFGLSTKYWYADSVTYGSPVSNRFNLVNPYQVSDGSEYASLKGKYTFRNSSESYTNSSVYYIVDVKDSTMYYVSLYYGETIEDYSRDYNYDYTLGDSYVDNGDGTYTLTNPTTLKRFDWHSNYDGMNNKYVCMRTANDTCSKLGYITSVSDSKFEFVYVTKFGNDVVYENGSYKLVDTDTSAVQTVLNASSNYNNTHYTCFNLSGQCTEVAYIFYKDSSSQYYYVTLSNGKKVEDAMNEMLWSDDVNSDDSEVKKTIDRWYAANMTSYTKYLEDTIFCYDRTVGNLGGWNPNGGDISKAFMFGGNQYGEKDLICKNKNDSFTVSRAIGNGKLTYPVGLLTSTEASLVNMPVIGSGSYYWLASPSCFDRNGVSIFRTTYDGGWMGQPADSTADIRPSVSLKFGMEYSDGDGSMDHPYVVDLGEEY